MAQIILETCLMVASDCDLMGFLTILSDLLDLLLGFPLQLCELEYAENQYWSAQW